MSRWRFLVAVTLIAAFVLPANAQTRLSVNVTDVTVTQLTNGMRITLKADGLLEVRTSGQWWETNEDHEFTLWLANAHSAVGTFVDVSRYPVNYLKLETPLDAREGVGRMLTVKMYRDAHVRSVELDDANYDWTWDWDPGQAAYDLRKSRSGNELIITVWSDRRELLPEDRKPRYDRDLPEDLSLEFTDGRVSVDALNVPLQALVSELADVTGVSIYVNDRVERLVTVRLVDVPMEHFVETLAAGIGLTASASDEAWFISDGLPSSLTPYTAGDSRTFRLNYVNSEDAIDLLPEFLLRYLRPGPSQDAIIAHGPPRLLDRIADDLRELDRPRSAVRLRAAMVEASSATGRQMMWSLLRGGSPTFEMDGPTGEVRISRVEEPQEDLVAQLRALAETEDVSVSVRPSLLVEEGQHASIFSGVNQFFQILRDGVTLDLDSTDAGVRLHVEPRVVGDEVISSHVALEVSTIRGTRQPPIVDSREASTTLLLRSGGSMIVAGGLMDHSESSERGGPALLAPVLPGRAVSSDQGREIVFLIGAEIVSGGDAGGGLAQNGGR
ncbi:MAG: hypothetical protein ACLFU7_09485 [Armatimonadota bacterium]